MTHLQEIQALSEKFTADVAKVLAKATKAGRHSAHPAEPTGASLVKVFFTGDRDGNTFAVCHPTGESKRVRRSDGTRVTAQIWKYSYENTTGTAQKRSWVGMLKTLDGHNRTATKVEVYRASGMETYDLS